MNIPSHLKCLILGMIWGCCLLADSVQATPLTATLTPAPLPSAVGFHMGANRAPDGTTIEVDSQSLLLEGKRWIPVMGEFHFSRYPENEWREELIKMKQGGIDIVATYVFWIHHEEEEGIWNWGGQRNLRTFIETAQRVGLKAVVRCGPWCHGEVRNGGTPDWVIAKGWRIRSNDPGYLEKSRLLYAQIAEQLRGLLWKEGGPVIGIQLENEYKGSAEHLLTLKRIAREVGLDVPLYTRTGWTECSTPLPFGEILPLYGVYAEGFWDRTLKPMPTEYRAGFQFDTQRTDHNIANEQLERQKSADQTADRYPFLTCEVGGGMMSAYHRRIRIDPRDVVATTLVKIGSGSNSPGYYMYHGGINPEGKLGTLMEDQDRGWNDLPVKNYDFQAPLGQFGQVRPQYAMLRRLHLFLHDFGAQLANTATVLPDNRPQGKDDTSTLRWAVRSDGESGFLFVNNYERLQSLPTKPSVQFALRLGDGNTLTFPDQPIDIPTNACFCWPFNLDLGQGKRLDWATAQPVCWSDEGSTRTYYFGETPGVPAKFAIVETPGATPVIHAAKPSRSACFEEKSSDGHTVRFMLLDDADSLRLIKDESGGTERFFQPTVDRKLIAELPIEMIKPPGPTRDVPLGKASRAVAAAPTDADFDQAAVWRIEFPADIDFSKNLLIRFHYAGDVARVLIGDRLIVDDFYNGDAFEFGLRRYAEKLKKGELRIAILPLSKDAPIGFSPPEAKPDFSGRDSIAELRSAELIELHDPSSESSDQ